MRPYIDNAGFGARKSSRPLLLILVGLFFSAWAAWQVWAAALTLADASPMQTAAGAVLVSGVVVTLFFSWLLLHQHGLREAAQDRADLAVAELQARQDELGLMLESTLDGMLRLDVQGSIVFSNYAGARLLGYDDPQALVGRHVSQLCVSPADGDLSLALPQAHVLNWAKEVVRAEPLSSEAQQFCRQDGSVFPVSILLTPVRHAGREQGALLAFSDITVQRNSDALLLEERQRWRKLLDVAPIGVAISYNTKVLFANPRYTELTGLHVGDSSANTYVHQEDRFGLYEVLKKQNLIYNYPLQVYNFEHRIVDVMLSALNYEFEGKVCLMSWVTDVSQMREAERIMVDAKSKAEEATQAKSDFLANMSHEIRTPMNAILGMSHLALQHSMDAKPRNFVEKVHKAASNLLGIINDILDYSKIEAGKLTIEQVELGLDAVLDTMRNLVALKAEDKGLEFRFDIPDDLPNRLIGDPLRLGQILVNLGNNAVKFTEHGFVHVSAKVVTRSDPDVELHFTVRDSGIGMTSEQCARLFQSFSQADGSTTRKYGGTGLGLVISKRMVEMMGGSIWVVSELGQGSEFHFKLPFGLSQVAAQEEIATSMDRGGAGEARLRVEGARASLRGARLLLVEDNEMNQELVLELLGIAGISATLANNGAEALALLASEAPFDGVLMDCQMPVMDGYTATRKLRSNPLWAHLPVIAMTANAMSGDRDKALEAGMNDHVAKPLNVDEMFTTIARWVKPAEPGNATPEPADRGAAKAPVTPLPPLVGIDTRLGLAYAAGAPALYRRVLVNFLRSQAGFVERFSAARPSADAGAATREAHTLKGTAGSIGAQALQQAAQNLEMACLQGATGAQIDALLGAVSAELLPVLASLQDLEVACEQTVGSAPLANIAGVRRMLEQLQRYCQESDSDAIELSEKLLSACAGTSSAQAVGRLNRVLTDFEFDQAQDLIQGLLVQLDPA